MGKKHVIFISSLAGNKNETCAFSAVFCLSDPKPPFPMTSLRYHLQYKDKQDSLASLGSLMQIWF